MMSWVVDRPAPAGGAERSLGCNIAHRRATGGLSLSALPFLLIPYDSLTHLAGADLNAASQTLPATALLSVAYLVLRGPQLRFSLATVRVAKWLVTLVLCLAVVTLVNMVLEGVSPVQGDEIYRLPTALRQGVSLSLGLSTFLMFQDALLRIDTDNAFRWVLIGGLPSLGIAAWQFLSGSYRVQGFSSEPSHLADMLVFAFLPACAFAAWPLPLRRVLGVAGVLSLFATFSSTGLLKAGMVLLAFFATSGRPLRGAAALLAIGVLVYLALALVPDNYVFLTIAEIYAGLAELDALTNASLIDRFFGLAGPLSVLDQARAWFGFGLGADSVYFNRLFDPDTADAIRDVKGDIPSIASLQGKMLLYGGLWGYAIYLGAWYLAWRVAPKGSPARYMIPALYLSSLFTLGPLFLPYVWMWLAIGSAAATSTFRTSPAPRTPR